MTRHNIKPTNTRVTISLNNEIMAKIREIQGSILRRKHASMSFSKALETLLKLGLKDFKIDDLADVVFTEALKGRKVKK